jgi:photosystem II stability/assembly factor-like uncharacterized protein
MDFPRRLSRIVFLALLVFPFPAAAGVGAWTLLGPDGGQVWAVAVDPSHPDGVYAGTTHGIFKSTDGGETWAASSRGLGPQGAWVRALLAVPGAVYAGTQSNGLFKSTDGGATWFSASTGLPGSPPGGGPNVGVLLQDPRNPNRIWAGTSRGLFFITNGGATWTTPFRGDPFDNPVLGVAIDPANGQIFVSVSYRGVYTSTNQGRKWVKVSRDLRASSYFRLVMDPRNRSTLFVGTGSGLWRTDDRGGHWKQVAGLPKIGYAYGIAWQGDRLFVGIGGSGVFYSDDRGTSWTPAQKSPEDRAIVELAAGPATLYAGTAGDGFQSGVFRSLDRGATWQPARSGMDSLEVDLVAVDPSDPDVLYASARDGGLFKSTDRGATWEYLAVGDSPPHLRLSFTRLFVDPSVPSTLYGGRGLKLFRSRDAGAVWDEITLPLYAQDLEADPRAPGALWAAGFLDLLPGTSVVYHSDDFGDTWEPVAFPSSKDMLIQVFEVDPQNPQVLWAAGGLLRNSLRLRVFRSADGGQTWQRRETGIDVPAAVTVVDLAIDPADANRVYAATESGLYRTTDAGLTWTRVPGLSGGVTEVGTSPTTPTTVYAFLSGFGVLRSTDGGGTWAPARRGLAPIPVLDLVVDPTDPRRLYAGTLTRSVFTYTEP